MCDFYIEHVHAIGFFTQVLDHRAAVTTADTLNSHTFHILRQTGTLYVCCQMLEDLVDFVVLENVKSKWWIYNYIHYKLI